MKKGLIIHPEIEEMLEETGFHPLDSMEWMTEKEPSLDTWSVCFVQRQI